jgi:RNA polymerase sigma-70 factor (ECF subfamily)
MTSSEDRFNRLFAEHQMALLGYAVRRVSDPSEAADVVAEVFLTAWRRIDAVPAGPQARPWLFGTARRVLANHHRGERRRHALADRLRSDLSSMSSVPDPADAVVQPSLKAALRQLSDDDQEILTLTAWEGLAREQIAVALGVSRSTLRLRLHRARRRLREALHDMQSGVGPEDGGPVGAPSSHLNPISLHPQNEEVS